MRRGKSGDDDDERLDAAERDDEAEQKEEMVRATENVDETETHESQRRLMPPRIEPHDTGIADEFERAHDSVGRQEAENRHDPEAQACKLRLNREPRGLRLDWVLEEHVHHRLIPCDFGVHWQRWPHHVPQRILVGLKRSIGRKGHARGRDARRSEPMIPLINRDAPGDPQSCRVVQKVVSFSDVEKTRSAQRKVDVAHRLEWHAR